MVYLKGKGYGFTVCHARHDSSLEPPAQDSENLAERVYEDSEFAFDSEEEALREIDATDVAITSQGM
jgi:hypothetical protein